MAYVGEHRPDYTPRTRFTSLTEKGEAPYSKLGLWQIFSRLKGSRHEAALLPIITMSTEFLTGNMNQELKALKASGLHAQIVADAAADLASRDGEAQSLLRDITDQFIRPPYCCPGRAPAFFRAQSG